MRLGYFTMPVHPIGRDWSQTLREDREAIILADRLGFYDAFIGEHLTDACENITNSMLFQATLIHDTKTIKLATGTTNLAQMHPVGDRGERGDVRSSGARPLHHGRLARRAALRFRSDRHFRPGPQQDLRRGDRRDPGSLGTRSALRHRFPGQPLQGVVRAHRRAAPRRRRHGASRSRSRGRRSSAPWWRRSRPAWC